MRIISNARVFGLS